MPKKNKRRAPPLTRKIRVVTLAQLRRHIRAQYTLLATTAAVLIGPGQHGFRSKPRIDLDAFEYGAENAKRWQANVAPAHSDIYYEGYVVGAKRTEVYPTERDALAALATLLDNVVAAMNPFVKTAAAKK